MNTLISKHIGDTLQIEKGAIVYIPDTREEIAKYIDDGYTPVIPVKTEENAAITIRDLFVKGEIITLTESESECTCTSPIGELMYDVENKCYIPTKDIEAMLVAIEEDEAAEEEQPIEQPDEKPAAPVVVKKQVAKPNNCLNWVILALVILFIIWAFRK